MVEPEQSKSPAKGGIPIDVWSGAYATKELHETIKEFVKSSNKASRRMLQLTWAIVVLTIIMLGAVIAQIVTALK